MHRNHKPAHLVYTAMAMAFIIVMSFMGSYWNDSRLKSNDCLIAQHNCQSSAKETDTNSPQFFIKSPMLPF